MVFKKRVVTKVTPDNALNYFMTRVDQIKYALTQAKVLRPDSRQDKAFKSAEKQLIDLQCRVLEFEGRFMNAETAEYITDNISGLCNNFCPHIYGFPRVYDTAVIRSRS